MKVRDLEPGMAFESPVIKRAIFIAQTQHPLWPYLQLVIWWLVNEEYYSFDALGPGQELYGTLDSDSDPEANLRIALLGDT